MFLKCYNGCYKATVKVKIKYLKKKKIKSSGLFHEINYLFLKKKYLNKAKTPLSHIDLIFALIPSKKLSTKVVSKAFILDSMPRINCCSVLASKPSSLTFCAQQPQKFSIGRAVHHAHAS